MAPTTGSCITPPDEENLQSSCLPLTVKLQRSARGAKVLSQSAVRILSRVPGSQQGLREGPRTSRYDTFDGVPFCNSANYVVFGSSKKCSTHIPRPHPTTGRSLLSILDMPVFTDQRNTNSTFREEPPKMVIFHENWDSPCNIDDPE